MSENFSQTCFSPRLNVWIFRFSVKWLFIYPSLAFLCLSAESVRQCCSWDAVRGGQGRLPPSITLYRQRREPAQPCIWLSDRPLFSLSPVSSLLLLCSQQLQIKHTVTEAEIQKLKNKVSDWNCWCAGLVVGSNDRSLSEFKQSVSRCRTGVRTNRGAGVHVCLESLRNRFC